ncbi:histidine phosphatase family protein [Pseudomonas japonica]|uniref:histidine phosphatase family protein n=1 Tax=Pseudomonas japonica TaxID=256466 RepID=UPI0015E45343|nr:histidine phosphatase family protein [Pseudomonas japonica]MBA1242711.1 histidine phosphatase family protein [Pseudomonas japonica]
MKLWLDLLRHGETERGGGFRGSLDDALTPAGWASLEAAVDGQGPWDGIVTSPLQRCAAFACALAQRLELPCTTVPGLSELHFGEWEGRSAADLMVDQAKALGRFWQDPFAYTPPGGEPLVAFKARIDSALAALVEEHPGQRLLVVSHAGVMRLLLARARGLPDNDLLQVEVAHGALHRVAITDAGALVAL